LNFEDRLKTAHFTQTELHVGSSFGEKSKQGSSPQDSSVIFEAVGGNTLLTRNPTAREETLSNPMFWRVIEQSEYKPVITLLSKQQQEEISSELVLVKGFLHILLDRDQPFRIFYFTYLSTN